MVWDALIQALRAEGRWLYGLSIMTRPPAGTLKTEVKFLLVTIFVKKLSYEKIMSYWSENKILSYLYIFNILGFFLYMSALPACISANHMHIVPGVEGRGC